MLALGLLAVAGRALAHDCSGPDDCSVVPPNVDIATGVAAGVAGVALGVAMFRARQRPEDDKPVPDKDKTARVRIESPADLIIQLCDKPLTFTARTEPPGREAEIQWDVPMQQHQTASTGSGPTFTTAWTHTGVKQVVATLDDSSDDLILFVFKTKAGTGTVRDLLDCEPPPIERAPRDYTWYRQHAIPEQDEEEVQA